MILLAGGNGFIGSHTYIELYNIGIRDILILDNLSNSKDGVVHKIEKITKNQPTFTNTDLLDIDKLDNIFNKYDIECVIHFAGLKAVRKSIDNPLEYYNNNISGTINLLRIMERYGCKNIIFSSSACVYGADPPFHENSKLCPPNPYGMTKLIIENILKDLFNSDNRWKIVILRYFNPLGAHSSGLLKEEPNNEPNNIMPIILSKMADVDPILDIYGYDYDTPDGTCQRDYIHVVDLAKAHVKAYEYIKKLDSCCEIFNIGTGKAYSVLDIVKHINNNSIKKLKYKFISRRKGDIPICYANVSKAHSKLDWYAKYNIDDMCKDSLRTII